MSSKSMASFASSCLIIAIFCGVNYYIIKDHCEISLSEISNAQKIHLIGGIVALGAFVLSVLQILNKFNAVRLFLYIEIVALFIFAGLMIYAAVLIFRNPCTISKTISGFTNSILQGQDSNIFTVKDGHLIAVFIMDVLNAILFLGTTSSVYYA